jgi:adenylate cyclase
MQTAPVYRFLNCAVDVAQRQVCVDGASVETQPKAFDLLVFLIEHRDRVVDKDELLRVIWPGVVVTESALTQCLRKTRAMVGDDGDRQAVIRTFQRRGFRFVAPLQATSSVGGEEAAAKAPDPLSVAVLPFADLSAQRDQQHLCDGIAEAIIDELTQNTQLHVASRTSACAFRDRAEDVREIGRRLSVVWILEGSVQRSGDLLRVTAQLIDVRSGFHTWSRRWDRRVEEIFAIQDEIARRVAESFHMGSSATRPLFPGRTTSRPTAYDLHLRGLSYLHRFSARSQRFAIDMFTQALAVDPGFARAWAGLAASHILLYRFARATEHHREEATRAAERAVELDPTSPAAWVARGGAATLIGDPRAAEAALKRAIELGPRHFEAHYYYGRAAIEWGELEHATALLERAAELRPDDYQALVLAAHAYRSLNQPENARRAQNAHSPTPSARWRSTPAMRERFRSLLRCWSKRVGRTMHAPGSSARWGWSPMSPRSCTTQRAYTQRWENTLLHWIY